MKRIKVVELFAGVGGFRLGLEAVKKKGARFEVVWSNQWEPGERSQYASEIYKNVFGSKNHSNEDIREVVKNKLEQIPNHDLLVGGFPCQDYSVARTVNKAKGIMGKKGVLWWSIYNILKKMGKDSPRFIMLENVNRLLTSPSRQKGRDFAIMLASLSGLGYVVEWRVINAADYGFPQKRKRVYILGYKKDDSIFNQINKGNKIENWIYKKGVMARAFPVKKKILKLVKFRIEGDLVKISKKFSQDKFKKICFENTGIMINRKVYTVKTTPNYMGYYLLLKDIIIKDDKLIPPEFFIGKKDIKKWKYLKGKKDADRKSKNGFRYCYSEGSMSFPDSLNKPSRTIVTGEGGRSPSRFKHVIMTKSGKLRRLVPLELEKLNMFPHNHTKYMLSGVSISDTRRAFLMGNALVVGVITKLGVELLNKIDTR